MKHQRSFVAFIIATLVLAGGWAAWSQMQLGPQDDFSDVAIPFEDELAGLEEEYNLDGLTKEATIEQAREYWRGLLEDENGDIPPDAWVEAQAQIEALKAQQISPAGAGITKDSWQWLGPGNIGGAITDIVFHPQFGQGGNEQMWASSAGGGLWKSDTAGRAWTPIDDFLPHMNVTSLLIDPNTPTTMYAGTGDRIEGISPGGGIFKSTNGGQTWSQLATTNPATDANWRSVYELAIASDSTILAAHAGQFAGQGFISRSTDGGAIWTLTNANTVAGGDEIVDVKTHPTDATKAVAATSTGKSLFSTDGGLTWTAATGWPGGGRIELAYAPSQPDTIYANLNVNKGELWRSIDGGQSYAQVNTGTGYLGSQGSIHTSLWVDPNNVNNVVVGGFEVWRSTNGGTNFTKITKYAPTKSPYPDQRIATSPPGNSSLVYLGSDGGIWRTKNIATAAQFSGWEDMIKNLGVTRYYGLAVNPQGVILGGTQDSGDNLFVGNPQKWSWVGYGDGGYAAADPNDPNYLYGEYVYLTIRRISNGGKSAAENIYGVINVYDVQQGQWTKVTAPNPLQDAIDSKANFIAPFILDPNDSNRLLGGGDRLWRTNEAKKPINKNPPAAPAWFPIKDSIGSNISAIDVATGNSDLIWVGHNGGQVFKSTNGTAGTPTWDPMGVGTLPSRQVSRITIDPNDTTGNTVYVTFGGFSGDNLYRTINGGTTWTDITSNLPDIPIFDIQILPGINNWLYVATELGIFTSENGGTNWFVNSDAPANVRVTELTWLTNNEGNTLYASTYGRGIFKAAVNTGGTPPTCFSLTVTINPTDTGQVTQTPPPNCTNGTQYSQGTIVTLTAAGKDGAVFQDWDGFDTSKTLKVTMDQDQSATANFTQDEVCYSLTTDANPFDGGTIDVTPAPNCSDGTRYKAGTNITLTANPDTFFDPYVFGTWTGTGSFPAAQNPVSLVINKDETVTAGFTLQAGNDDFDNAGDFGDFFDFGEALNSNGIAALQATDVFTTFTVNTSNATQDATDPVTCEGGASTATVWYKFEPPITGTLFLDTTGSQYNTNLTVYEGDDLNNLVSLECDDDTEDDGVGFDNEDFFDDEEFLDFFDDDEFFDDFYEDGFFDEFYDEDDFFDFYDEGDFFNIEEDEASEEELAQLEIEMVPGTTYYILISDTTSPQLFPQSGELSPGIVEDQVPAGGFLVVNALFSTNPDDIIDPPADDDFDIFLPLIIK